MYAIKTDRFFVLFIIRKYMKIRKNTYSLILLIRVSRVRAPDRVPPKNGLNTTFKPFLYFVKFCCFYRFSNFFLTKSHSFDYILTIIAVNYKRIYSTISACSRGKFANNFTMQLNRSSLARPVACSSSE